MSWIKIFLIVTFCALAGMLMAGAFGFLAGTIAPDFFRHVIPWEEFRPVGIATFFGATIGVILGGGLGCLAVIIQAIFQWRKHPTN